MKALFAVGVNDCSSEESGRGTCHSVASGVLGPWSTTRCAYRMVNAVAVNSAVHPAVHKALTLMRDVSSVSSEKTYASRVVERFGSCRWHVSIEQMVDPLGNCTVTCGRFLILVPTGASDWRRRMWVLPVSRQTGFAGPKKRDGLSLMFLLITLRQTNTFSRGNCQSLCEHPLGMVVWVAAVRWALE
jgi:hypothetical protein